MSATTPAREALLDDLLATNDTESALSEDEVQLITSAFDALDQAPEVSFPAERRDAIREMLALDFAPEVADPALAEAARGLEDLPRDSLTATRRASLLDDLLSRVSAFTPGDDRTWVAATLASFVVLVMVTGVRDVPTNATSNPMVIAPTLFLLAAGAVGMRLTRAWSDGALHGVLMAGVAAMTLGAIGAGGAEAFQSSASISEWSRAGLPCLGLGTATALFAALPFVVMRSGVRVGEGARLGAMGAITGAAVLHAHCPISMLDHMLFHALAIGLAAAMGGGLVFGKERLLALLSPGS